MCNQTQGSGQICKERLFTCSGPLSNIFLVLGNWWEWGVYCTPMLPTLAGLTDVMSRLTGCFVTSFVRLELLVLVVGGDPLKIKKEGKDLDSTGQETHPHLKILALPISLSQSRWKLGTTCWSTDNSGFYQQKIQSRLQWDIWIPRRSGQSASVKPARVSSSFQFIFR